MPRVPSPPRRQGAKTVRFLLRLPAAVHDTATQGAAIHGVSLNEYCVRRLSLTGPPLTLHPDAAAVVARAQAVAPGRVLGVVLHGSWARGEARAASDVDVLVVVASDVQLTRALYRHWDQEPVLWEGRSVDAHFVHLPEAAHGGGVWCEAAIDGHVLSDPEGRVGAALATVRRAIADGRLVRKRVHGQPYWTEVA